MERTLAPPATLADAVRRRIAVLALREVEAATVGEFVLRPAQREAVRDINRAIARYGGALLADPPGTGKTVIALAVAQRAHDVLVAAPAALRDQWLAAAARARIAIRFASLESLSHGADPPRPSLLIIDEAHHARTATTHRYARLARLAMGTPVLLVTATPVVNSLRDRDALLALFLGARARDVDQTDLARLMVRRADEQVQRPVIRRLPALSHAADLPGVADALRALPPPLPTADGAVAAALLRSSMAMAWASSLAALDATLRRRLQRGAALRDALADGRWPSRATLRRWIIGDDATQLAFPLLLDDSGRAPPADALAVLSAHLSAVRALRAAVTPHVEADTAARAGALRALIEQHPERRIALFAQHAATIVALYGKLSVDGGIVGIIGDRVRAAHGRWTRRDVLQSLGPRSRPFAARDPQGIRVLLTTDLLAEGVELQGVGIVVHGDPVWTPARLRQRVGRAARIGGGDSVLVARYRLPTGAADILRLAPRLDRKATEGAVALGAARAEERLRHCLHRWSARASAPKESPKASLAIPNAPASTQSAPPTVVATVTAEFEGFLGVLQSAEGALLVAGRRTRLGWRIETDPRALLRTVMGAEGVDAPTASDAVRDVRRVLARWLRRQRTVRSAGLTPTMDPRLDRALRRRIDAAVAASPLVAREEAARTAAAALAAVRRAPGSGVTRALDQLCRVAYTPTAFLDALRDLARLVVAGHPPRASTPRLAALLLLTPRRATPAESPHDSLAPRAAWPGSAAPR